jgi:flavin-dependent dehydrogenase
MYDAIVIGARCAGSPTAMLLARRGHRVLLLDRSTFPSDHLSTHFIHLAGVACLKRWGLLERVRATNCPPIKTVRFDFGLFSLSGAPPATPCGVSEALAPRRKVLDKILLDAAREAGAEVREGFVVREILKEGGRVAGIRGQAQGGPLVTEHARITIGADGLHSVVARAVEAPVYQEKPSLTCGYYTYWADVPVDGVEVYLRENLCVIAFPTNDAQALVVVLWPNSEFPNVRARVEESYMRALEATPQLMERVRGGRRAERFYGTADVPNFFRQPYGDGWALVGDAGYHKDPISAQGITDSFRDAELVAAAIDDGLSGRRPLEEALADYERRRNEAAMPGYEFTCLRATLAPPEPEMLQLIFALQGNQEQIDRFMGMDAGTFPVQEFFSPENLGRIMARGGSTI